MAHLAGTELTLRERRDMNSERVGNQASDLADRDCPATTNVDWQAIELVCLRRQQVGAGDVFDEAEIARLGAVFIEDRRLLIEQTRAENGNDAGVRVEDRLARAISAGVTQSHRRNAGLLAPGQDELFLIHFGDGIDGLAAARRGLRRGRRLRAGATLRAMRPKVSGAQFVDGPRRREDQAMLLAARRALAVNRLR